MTKVKASNRKQHIYLEAAKLFRERGYPSTSMRDLAQVVGLEPSSLYSHIRSKEEILQSICFECANRFLKGISSITESGKSTAEKIRAVIDLHVTIAFDDPGSITVFNDEWRHLSDAYLSDFLQMRKTYERYFMQILQEGIITGELKSVDPVITMQCILSSLRWVHLRPQKHLDKRQLVDSIGNIFLGGLLISKTSTSKTV